MFIRKPAVADAFYPQDWNDIESYLNSVIRSVEDKIKPRAVIVPHAGYIYSGHVAAKAYELIDSFDTYIVIGPNHTGIGEEISVFEGIYKMPFGSVETDEQMVEYIVNSSSAAVDYYAHLQEHSIEVQLPFIEYISNKPYKIVPIVIGTHNRTKLRTLADALTGAINSLKKDVLIVVSSDMNHYESRDITLKKDALAIEKIEDLDEEGLFDVVESNNISMCGVAGSYTALVAAKLLGAESAFLVDHRTSGDVNGDYSQVVGYASIIVE